jgi:hypothetical protein
MVKSGLVLDAAGGSNEGTSIIQYGYHGGGNQKWKFEGGALSLVGGLCIQVNISNEVSLGRFFGGIWQKWILHRV